MAKERMKKLTVIVPESLVVKALRASKQGITPTVRMALERVAAEDVYERLLRLEGKVKFSRSWQELRGDE